jgi:hypothetical protein
MFWWEIGYEGEGGRGKGKREESYSPFPFSLSAFTSQKESLDQPMALELNLLSQ